MSNQCTNVCSPIRGACAVAHSCELDSDHHGAHRHPCTRIADLERVVIERAVQWKQTEGDGHTECEALDAAVDALLREREHNYLMGGCTESECRLCHLAPYARKSGMKHSGLS